MQMREVKFTIAMSLPTLLSFCVNFQVNTEFHR
jgi:hypothetical protein